MTPIKVTIDIGGIPRVITHKWINPDHIVLFEPKGDRALIHLNNDTSFEVVEGCNDLVRLLSDARYEESIRREPQTHLRSPGW